MGSGLFLPGFALAENCPSRTTVKGTMVTFVGELTDTGGDGASSVWFEYGRTTSYSDKTIKKDLSQPGFYCITVSGLLPSTTYNYRAAAKNSAGTAYGENMTFTTTEETAVNIKANDSDGPITIPYNSSATLTWTSSNASSCYASGAWSGSKSISGSQSTGSLTSSKTYTITCEGPRGSDSDSVRINIESEVSSDFFVRKTVRNFSRGTSYDDLVQASPGEMLTFGVVIFAGKDPLYDVTVKDSLPAGLLYRGDLRVDNVLTSGDIFDGLNIGHIPAAGMKTVTFRADVAGEVSFSFGQTKLINSVEVSSRNGSGSDTAEVIVSKTAVAGAATNVPTGWTNNLFLDSFFLPLSASLFVIWLLKARILRIEEWLDARNKKYQEYKSKKVLKLKIAKIKFREAINR